MVFSKLDVGLACTWTSHDPLLATSFIGGKKKKVIFPSLPPQPMLAGAGAQTYGGLMERGYIPPGQFEDLLYLVRKASSAANKAAEDARLAEMAASAAGVAGQQTIVKSLHLGAKIHSGPDPCIVALCTNTAFASVKQLQTDRSFGQLEKRKQVKAKEFLHILESSDESRIKTQG
mmetsp:Transcript_126085/g.223280  ORF Transcript_126085/g.223280 Transcript_126085/m.223280 type:complete len:175 (+) Transcript_126085:121-645(+)